MLTDQSLNIKKVTFVVVGEDWNTIPGNPIYIPILLINLGRRNESVELEVIGLHDEWLDNRVLWEKIGPEEHKKVVLKITPPVRPGSSAGTYTVKLQLSRAGLPKPDEIVLMKMTVTD